ncbi:protein kinase, putative [Eimeria brunetti]|uniref:Protein kinase, putative n=1 Tax=Eimeria brunetti TaxID=51314 RepID=U6LR67_9EIME|nr:protein kinase, putative [Eimeria brunetti]
MAGSFVDGEAWNLLNPSTKWGVPSTSPPSQMAASALGEWAPMGYHSGSSTDSRGTCPATMQCAPQPNAAAAPPWPFEDKSAGCIDASERQLQIFCIDGEGRPRMTCRKEGGGGGEPFSPNRRRPAKQSPPPPAPSKFELAAVAALCNTAPRAPPPPSVVRPPKPFRFPSAQSFVPGRQLPAAGPAFLAAADREAAAGACSLPLTPISRPDGRPTKTDAPADMYAPFPGLVAQAQARPCSPGPWENQVQHSSKENGGGWMSMGALYKPSAGSGASLLRCSSPSTGWAPASQWQGQQPGGVAYPEAMRSPHQFTSPQHNAAPVHTAGPMNYSFIQSPPDFSVTGTSYCDGSASRLPHGWKESNPEVRQAAFAEEEYNSRVCLPLVKPWQPMPQRPVEEAQETSEDQRAEVVTIYGTDRFWDLMGALAELQRGPTSLLSSSVTFDSVLLPGGELQYSMIEQGSFGKVFVGSHQGAKVAIKVPVECMLSTDPAGVMERTLNEWRILSMCQHPNVVRLIGGIVHGPFDVWLVTQLVNGSDLHSRKYSRDPLVRRFISPENGLYMCRQLAAVVAYLHIPVPGRKPIVVHRDIKPENVLIADDWTIQLCDFGDAEASADGRVSRISGATWFYAPAELLRCSPVESMASKSGVQLPPFNEKWDIWSMGCVFQEMFGFFNPMHVHISSGDSPSVIYEKLKSKAIAGALVPNVAEEIQGVARNIILRCLHPDPSARPSAVEVLNMWSAPDEDILKDIHTRPSCPQPNVLEATSFNSTNRQHYPPVMSGPQQLVPNLGSLCTEANLPFMNESTKGDMGNSFYGQAYPSSIAHAAAGSAGALLLENRDRDKRVAKNAFNTPNQLSAGAWRSLITKQGAKFVHPQGLPAAAGWQ